MVDTETSGNYGIRRTHSDGEDTLTPKTGWTIADTALYRDRTSTGTWTSSAMSRRIRINGSKAVPNTAPTASNNTVTTNEDTAYTFAASDFNFADTDSSDTLASVKIVTLPSVGSLTHDGNAVTANQVVTKADIDANKLVFTPVANANGAGYASFTFKVSDGKDESALAYTMTIRCRLCK